jgi:ABC-type transporter MlaC component
MNRKFIVAILLVAALPAFAQAQNPSAAKVTKADVQKVFKIISGNKTKTQTYCNIVKLASQITEGSEQNTDELYQKIEELVPKLGREYVALMDALQDIEPESQVGQEIESVLVGLNRLCTR